MKAGMNPMQYFWKIQSIPRNLIHLFDQIRITNILRLDIRSDKINNKNYK